MRAITRAGATALLAAGLTFCAAADQHVLPLDELHQQAQSAAEQRARNIADIERVLSYPAAAEALTKSNVSEQQMKRAVATLDDQELARMAERARASEN